MPKDEFVAKVRREAKKALKEHVERPAHAPEATREGVTTWALTLVKTEKKVTTKKDEDEPETKWKYTLEELPLKDIRIVVASDSKLPWTPDAQLQVTVRSPFTQTRLVEEDS